VRALNFSTSQSLYRRGEMKKYEGIFQSLKAYIEGGELEIFPSPRAYISFFRDGKLEIILSPDASIERKSSEFFKVPKPV